MLFKKILKLWNISRAGTKLSAYLDEILHSIPNVTTTETYQKFYWSEIIKPENISYYRDNSIEKRAIDDIASEEVSIAMMEIMCSNLSVNKDELIRVTAKQFGLLKVGSQIETVMTFCVDDLIGEKLLMEKDGRIVLNSN